MYDRHVLKTRTQMQCFYWNLKGFDAKLHPTLRYDSVKPLPFRTHSRQRFFLKSLPMAQISDRISPMFYRRHRLRKPHTSGRSNASSGAFSGSNKPEENKNAPPESISATENETAETASSSPRSSDAKDTRQVVALVSTLMIVGIILSVITVFLVTNVGLKFSVIKVLRKFFKSDIARQVLTIIGCMLFVRSGLTPLTRAIREFVGIKTSWENSVEYFLLRELYNPLEFLLVVAAIAALSETLLPPLISVQRIVIQAVVRAILSLTFVMAAARVVYNMKGRLFREAKWKLELEGKTTEQHRIDAIDKLMTVGIFIVASVMCLQSIGLDVNSVLAIGGVGGLAIGLAGREIFENLFSGLLIMGSRAFEVGDEVVLFSTSDNKIEGIVADVGWYRTVVRDFQREVYIIPNSLFSRTVVLNVTRKGKEWRFFEFLPIRVKDLDKAEAIVADIRRIIRQDSRVINKLHKRAFLDAIDREFINIYISFYIEAPNRDAFMGYRQQFLMDFVDCIARNGAQIAEKKLFVEFASDMNPDERVLMEDSLQTMDMVDVNAETLISPEKENGSRNFRDELNISSSVQSVSPMEDSRQPVIKKKQDFLPPGRYT